MTLRVSAKIGPPMCYPALDPDDQDEWAFAPARRCNEAWKGSGASSAEHLAGHEVMRHRRLSVLKRKSLAEAVALLEKRASIRRFFPPMASSK